MGHYPAMAIHDPVDCFDKLLETLFGGVLRGHGPCDSKISTRIAPENLLLDVAAGPAI